MRSKWLDKIRALYATCTLDWSCKEASETRASVWSMYVESTLLWACRKALVAKEVVGYNCGATSKVWKSRKQSVGLELQVARSQSYGNHSSGGMPTTLYICLWCLMALPCAQAG